MIGASLIFVGTTVDAAPLLDDPIVASDGTLLFPDSRDPNVLYYPPLGVRLAWANGMPRFGLIKSVGIDSHGELVGGGMVGLTLDRIDPDNVQRLAWRASLPQRATLRPLKAEGVKWRLLVTAADSDSPTVLATRDVPWQRQSVSFALGTSQTTLLWSALESAGNLALIADLVVITKGVRRLPSTLDGREYAETERLDRFSIPLEVSRDAHPSLFSLIHRADHQRFDYRRLDVYCFDFAESVDTLLHVLVDVQLESPRGQIERHSLSFSPVDEPMQSIEFRLPAHLEHQAQYRVTRLGVSGNRRITSWKEIEHEHLDITDYEIEIADHE